MTDCDEEHAEEPSEEGGTSGERETPGCTCLVSYERGDTIDRRGR